MSIATFLAPFQAPAGNPELLQAQAKALSKRLPLLFFIAVVNTLAVAYTHYGAAAPSLTVVFPTVVTIACLWQAWQWLKMGDSPISDADAATQLNFGVLIGPAFSVLFLLWGLALYRYGDAYAKAHVLFYMGVTLVGCAFCTMHVRAAALMTTGVTVVPLVILLLATGRPVFVAIAIGALIVSATMVYILLGFARDHARMIDYQKGLVASLLENARLANVDSLTDLPNRRRLLSALQEDLERAQRDRRRLAVGMIDLDGFKTVNDLYGHTAGDSVLIEAGRRLSDLCGDEVLLARLGGDEFGVIVDEGTSDADLEALGVRICDVLQAPFVLAGIVVEISSCVGFAAFPEAGSTAEVLFERARYALSHAKQHRRGRPTIFSIEHETDILNLANLEHCLRHADLQSEMSLHFQPIVDVERGKTVGFEALARWNSPTLGKIAPDVFIRVAERSDLIHKLTTTLLRRALAEAKTWPSEIRISFNLSARDIASREAIASIAAIIENSGVSPDRIDLEVTETAMIHDFEQAHFSLQTLRALGLGISLDDFGAGNSSLRYVQRFPIDKIKIDRSFVSEVETKPSCRAIVKSMIDLCRNLKLICIVEGMETDDQVRVLLRLGCKTMQGYHFGKPMPAAEVPSFLAAANFPTFLDSPRGRALAS